MSVSTIIKSIQDIMRKDAGVDGDAQRIGQVAWLLIPESIRFAGRRVGVNARRL